MDVYSVRISSISSSGEEMMSVFSADELHRARKISRSEVRHSYIVCRYVLRRLLAGYLNIAPEKICFAYGEKGKPRLANNNKAIEFNLSHSRDLLLVAIGGGTVGVDVEYMRDLKGYLHLAKRFFTQKECEFIEVSYNSLQSFYDIWTAKEAYLKHLGLGIADGLSSFSVVNNDELVETLSGVRLSHLDVGDDYCAALASSSYELPVFLDAGLG